PNLARSALIVIDMQNHFFSIAGHIVKRLIPLIELYRERNLPVIFTQHGHLPDDKGSLVRRWGPPGNGSILRYSDDWKLMPELDKLAAHDERLEDKSQYDAFLNTALEERLRARGVTTVVITGTLTNLCCETTAREAFCRDFEVVVLDDGCAAASAKHHRATLENIEFGF
ncbi:Isochorismatase hydrolase, partial [Gloeophyllum trabeum ATCC 11539]